MEAPDGAAHHRRAEPAADERARRDGGVPGRAHDLGGRRVLADEAGGAGLHGREDLVVAGVHGEHDEPGAVAALADRADDVEAGAVRQLEVGDDDVGRELVVRRERPRRRCRRCRRSSCRPPARRRRRARSRISSWSSTRRTRVGSSLMRSLSHPGRRGPTEDSANAGVRTWTRVPPRGPGLIESEALISAARSRMISSPWESWRGRCSPWPSSVTVIRASGACTTQCTSMRLGPGVAHRVGHRLLADPEQLGLDLRSQPRRRARPA